MVSKEKYFMTYFQVMYERAALIKENFKHKKQYDDLLSQAIRKNIETHEIIEFLKKIIGKDDKFRKNLISLRYFYYKIQKSLENFDNIAARKIDGSVLSKLANLGFDIRKEFQNIIMLSGHSKNIAKELTEILKLEFNHLNSKKIKEYLETLKIEKEITEKLTAYSKAINNVVSAIIIKGKKFESMHKGADDKIATHFLYLITAVFFIYCLSFSNYFSNFETSGNFFKSLIALFTSGGYAIYLNNLPDKTLKEFNLYFQENII